VFTFWVALVVHVITFVAAVNALAVSATPLLLHRLLFSSLVVGDVAAVVTFAIALAVVATPNLLFLWWLFFMIYVAACTAIIATAIDKLQLTGRNLG
jgi:hypothetical protein